MEKSIRLRNVPSVLAEHVAQLQSRGYDRKEVARMVVNECLVPAEEAQSAIELAGPWPSPRRAAAQ